MKKRNWNRIKIKTRYTYGTSFTLPVLVNCSCFYSVHNFIHDPLFFQLLTSLILRISSTLSSHDFVKVPLPLDTIHSYFIIGSATWSTSILSIWSNLFNILLLYWSFIFVQSTFIQHSFVLDLNSLCFIAHTS